MKNNNTLQELLPCPFCGGKANTGYGEVFCNTDGCGLADTMTPQQWNTRAQPAPAAGVVECPDCNGAGWFGSGEGSGPCDGECGGSKKVSLKKIVGRALVDFMALDREGKLTPEKFVYFEDRIIAAIRACGISSNENHCKDVCAANTPSAGIGVGV